MSPATRAGPHAALALAALGVVFGDIGTSPLYALHAAFGAHGEAVAATRESVYGIVSLIVWTITVIVCIKYVGLIMRADNGGEGGILALVALAQRTGLRTPAASAVLLLGILGASLFYGDGMITPAISVLSAVEGLDVAAPGLRSFVVPIALVVLVLLFGAQRYGTGALGRLFGPVMALWFTAIGLIGLREVVGHSGILASVSPTYGLAFLLEHSDRALVVLGAVILTVTGAEALYADMGHFGRAPIRRAWFLVVFPALILNYMGQGAVVLHDRAALENPFFVLTPSWARLPMVVLATAATVIASQAVISGAFSLTHQGVQLGFLPRLTIRHTSAQERGQIYVPAVNWALCIAVAALVIAFGSSTRLASAYGIAVTGTMATTTVLFFFVVRTLWRRPLWLVVPAAAAFLAVELSFLAATLTKVGSGGWVPLVVGLATFTVLTTWRTGHRAVTRSVIARGGPLRAFIEETRALRPPVFRAPRTGVFLQSDRDTTPLALRANVEHDHVMHENVLIVLILTTDLPHVESARRVAVDALGYRGDGITLITARYGYLDRQSLPEVVEAAAQHGVEGWVDVERVSYFVSRITLVRTDAPVMRPWRKRLFVALSRNQADPEQYLGLPDERTVTMGSLIEF